MTTRFPVALGVLALLALALPSWSVADHVTANPSASARLGEPIGDRSWEVVVAWNINCSGAATPDYGGDLYLVDQATGEKNYLGGTFAASGEDTLVVSRKSTPRYLYPQIRAFCSSGLPLLHGSGTVEAIGGIVEVPPLAWAELTFRDECPPTQPDPVAKAKRSEAATRKARAKRTSRGEAPHSFESLIDELSLRTRNTIRVEGAEASFERLTEPTGLQARALELIERIPRQT